MYKQLPFEKGLLCLIAILLFSSFLIAQTPRVSKIHSSENYQPQANNDASTFSFTRTKYRSIDGTYNNLWHPHWGAAGIAFKREIASAYSDGFNSLAGYNRKSPREISNLLCLQPQSIPNQQQLSSFVFTWGQFIDHDINLTAEGHTEFAPISLPANEGSFRQPIPFMRSEIISGSGIYAPREQKNLNTSWLDASMVYGSDPHKASWLRTYRDGKMKTSAGNLLPYNTSNGEKYGWLDPNAPAMSTIPGSTTLHFVAGDIRANEQPGLTALHTLFVREHNRYCEVLKSNGHSNDEIIYQKARKWVGALIQAITFNEFLPALGINLPPPYGYNTTVQPDISNEFATAAFRLGHTMVTDQLVVLNGNCYPLTGNNSLVGNFFNLNLIETWGIEPILRGLSTQTQEAIDLKLVENLRSFLFEIPGLPPAGLDLAALNIQRGRDHGLADYNTFRQHFLGNRAIRFNQITNNISVRQSLKQAYNYNINNIDLWTGLLAEDHAPNASVGPTLQAILQIQFQRLRDGDYFYYEWDPDLTANKKQRISTTRLSRIIERNTSIRKIANNLFKAGNCFPNNQHNRVTPLENPLLSETVDNTLSPAVTVFPNPTSDIVHITLTDFRDQQIQLVLHDQVGRRLYERRINKVATALEEVKIESLDNGIYFLTIIPTGNAPISKKVFVQKF